MPHRLWRLIPALLCYAVLACDSAPTEPSHAPATLIWDHASLVLDDSASATISAAHAHHMVNDQTSAVLLSPQ